MSAPLVLASREEGSPARGAAPWGRQAGGLVSLRDMIRFFAPSWMERFAYLNMLMTPEPDEQRGKTLQLVEYAKNLIKECK